MDIDDVAQQQQQQQEAGPSGEGPSNGAAVGTKKAAPAGLRYELKEDDPFDLEAYVAPYTDRRRIDRLLFVGRNCPTLRVKAYQLALDAIKLYSLDYRLYLDIGHECPEATVDEEWAEEARVKQESGLDKLDVELKNYQNNLIKESIRMGFRDIGDFQRKSGDLSAAVKAYTKSKEFCTTSQHIFDMSMSIVDTALDQRSYSTARSYALKAETSLTHISGTGNKAAKAEAQPAALPGMLSTGSKREEEQRSKHFQLLREKISVAVSVAELGTSEFARAARGFLNASPPPPVSAMGAAPSTSSGRDNSATNTAHFISSGDIGLYGVLCGMATMDRDQFKRLVLDNVTLRPFLEHTPFLKELILLYHNSKFLAALQLLEHNMARLILDIHLSRHVNRLLGMIKDRMVQFYLTPFRAVKIDKMAGAFGWDAGVTEMEVIRLVEDGKVQVRVDTRDRTLHAHDPDERDALYRQTLKVAAANDKAARALAYRMKLVQNDLIVDVKKDSTQRPVQFNQQQQGSKSGGKGGNKKEKADGSSAADAVEVIDD